MELHIASPVLESVSTHFSFHRDARTSMHSPETSFHPWEIASAIPSFLIIVQRITMFSGLTVPIKIIMTLNSKAGMPSDPSDRIASRQLIWGWSHHLSWINSCKFTLCEFTVGLFFCVQARFSCVQWRYFCLSMLSVLPTNQIPMLGMR